MQDQGLKKDMEPILIDVYLLETDLDVRAFAERGFCRSFSAELARWGIETRERYCSPCG